MRKVVYPSAGSYDKIQFHDVPDLPAPSKDDLIIQTHSIGVNYGDVLVRLGVYESAKKVGWPITPGFEVSGMVKAVGPDVKKFKVGDKVLGFTLFNGYATEVLVNEAHTMPVPKGFSMEEAAGFAAVFFTAYHAVFQEVYIPPHAKVLIHSAAGGVGSALTQLCVTQGFYTVGVIGSSHKREHLEKFKPNAIIDKSTSDLWTEARRLAPDGYHAIFDANGYTTLQASYDHLMTTGKLISYGSHDLLSKSGGRLNYLKAGWGLLRTPTFKPLELISHNKSISGFNVSFLFGQKELIADCSQGLQRLLDSGHIQPTPTTAFPFADAAKAHKLIESGKSVGKIVLSV